MTLYCMWYANDNIPILQPQERNILPLLILKLLILKIMQYSRITSILQSTFFEIISFMNV